MSTLFNPEKVERFEGIDVDGKNGSKGWGSGLRLNGDTEMVQSSDYDQLLALYLPLREFADSLSNLPQHLWSDKRYRQEVARQNAGPGWIEASK